MFPEERRKAILEALGLSGRVEVGTLAQRLGVSEVTIRQDLAFLEEHGRLRRTHGGAIPIETGFELPFAFTETANASEKAAIGRAAAAMIRNGETVFLDVGTTVTAVARAISGRAGLTVATNALNIAAILENSPGINVIVTGGTLRAVQHSLVNPLGLEILSRLRADRAFLGASGVEADAGVTNANLPEAEIKSAMMRYAREKILVADGSKIGRIAAALVAPAADFDLLITGETAPQSELDRLMQKGLAVRTVCLE